MSGDERQAWDLHWRGLRQSHSLFGSLASVARRLLFSRVVGRYTERYFAADGLFVETGCGTSEASAGIGRERRRLVGLDFSLEALDLARRRRLFDTLVCADIRHLPFRDESVAGLWNLGVMEHFPEPVGAEILGEFHRVLEPGRGTSLLFWPPTFGLSRWILAPIEWLRSRLSGRPFRFFPDEVHRLKTRRSARDLLEAAGLEPLRVDFTPRDGFNHLILVARKKGR